VDVVTAVREESEDFVDGWLDVVFLRRDDCNLSAADGRDSFVPFVSSNSSES